MTVTRRRGLDESPDQAAAALAKGWRQLARMIRQELNKPHRERWHLEGQPREANEQKRLEYIMRIDDKNHKPELEYLCVLEAHLSGWPHMHLILRSRYIPHDWLTQKTTKVLQSRVVGISYVKHGHSPASYVAKYVGKSPHRFGTTKRYWMSKKYIIDNRTDALRVFPECWKWEMSDDTIPQIYAEWLRYNREPWQVRGGGIAWGWWFPDLEKYIADRKAGGARARHARRDVAHRHSARARSA